MPPVLKSPEGTFSLYSTFEEVIMAQGAPDSQKKTESREDGYFWYKWNKYLGEVPYPRFEPWRTYKSRLLQCYPLITKGYSFLGLNGFTTLVYRGSQVLFGSMPDCSCNQCQIPKYVIAWANNGNLNLTDVRWRMQSIEYLYQGLNYGMSIEQVLISQGNPVMIIPEYNSHGSFAPVTCFDNLEQSALRFYYGNVSTGISTGGVFNFPTTIGDNISYINPAEIVFSPKHRLLTRFGASKTKQGIEWAKEHKRMTVERIEQTVIGFSNNEYHFLGPGFGNKGDLVLDATEAVKERKHILQKENSLRWLDMLELQEFVTSMKEEVEAKQTKLKDQQEKKSKEAFQEFLGNTVNSSTYDKGLGLELFSQKLLEAMGWQIEHSGKPGDGGADLIGFKSDDLVTLKIVVQCKHQDSVAEDVVVQTFGKAQSENADRAYVITTGTFTDNAKECADDNKSKTVLIDGAKLKELSVQYLDI